MSQTVEQRLAALEEAIESGALKVKYSDKEIEYRSLDEMQRIANSMRRRLGRSKSSAAYPTFSKGL